MIRSLLICILFLFFVRGISKIIILFYVSDSKRTFLWDWRDISTSLNSGYISLWEMNYVESLDLNFSLFLRNFQTVLLFPFHIISMSLLLWIFVIAFYLNFCFVPKHHVLLCRITMKTYTITICENNSKCNGSGKDQE